MKVNTIYSKLLFIIIILLACPLLTLAQINNDLYSGENYAQQANSFFEIGDWKGGKEIIDIGLKKHPTDSDLKMLLGKYYFEQGEYDQARYELNKALDFNANNVDAKQVLVNVEIVTQRYSSAICYLNELLEANPYWKGLWAKKMEVYRLQGNAVEANRLLARLNKIYPNDSEIKNAYLYYVEEEIANKKKAGEINKAIDLSMILVEEEPQNSDFYLELINNCLKAGDYEKALNNAERGLYNQPDNIKIIDKKIDILGELHEYEDLLSFIKLKSKTPVNKTHLERRYNYFLQEAAQHYRKTNPYTLYGMLYERNPQNEEAFNYVVTIATASGLYDDALLAIRKAKITNGDTKNLLLREHEVYKRMGQQNKADQLTEKLYQLYSGDLDVQEQYANYQLQQAKANIQQELYPKALGNLKQVLELSDDEDIQKTALISMHNCFYQLDKHNEAIDVLNTLKSKYPNELEWQAKTAVIYGKQGMFTKALNEYEQVLLQTPESDYEWMLIGYNELANEYTKQLIEEQQWDKAHYITLNRLNIDPDNDAALRYAINISAQKGDYINMEKYALHGLNNNSDDLHFGIKLSEAYNAQKQHKAAMDILSGIIAENPNHKELVNAYSQASADYAQTLLSNAQPNEAILVLDNALLYNSKNKTLNYWKGIAHEKNKQYDSAYYYLSLYEPSSLEIQPFTRHMHFLRSKTHKNQIGIYHMRSRFSDLDIITTLSTVEYIRFGIRNTFTGRANYTGRDAGKGIQGQLEWDYLWCPSFYSNANIAISNDFFPSFIANISGYKSFKNDWEVGLSAGYRHLSDDKTDIINTTASLSKEIIPWWLNARFSSVIVNSEWYYTVMAQARYTVIDNGYITAMASIGSAPDVDIIDNQLYNAFSVTNTMVGLGGNYMLNHAITVGILGTWYNYKDTSYTYENANACYRNLYNIQLQLHINF